MGQYGNYTKGIDKLKASVKNDAGAKKSRHKWDGNKVYAVCINCGCEREKRVYSVYYKMIGGEWTRPAPECKTKTKK